VPATAPPWLPPFNTALIVVSGVFLLVGYYFIRTRRIVWHRHSMLTAATFAALFLVVYVARWALFPTKTFVGDPLVRTFYLLLLGSHVIVATLVAPFAFVTLRRALGGRFTQHKQIARITLPMWLYAVVTGWIVYVMLQTSE
jgi:putative membrane protein